MTMKSFGTLTAVLLLLAYSACKSGDQGKDNSTALFTLLTPEESGVAFQNTLTEGPNTNILMYEYFYNGGGVSAGDFNGDGLIDLYLTSNMADNRLYLNKGNLKFEDITERSGAGGRPGPWKTGVNTVDINGDGKLDIFVCYSGALPPQKRANQLFINKGNLSDGVPFFEEQAEAYGLASTGFSNQAYFFDHDRDGDLDMLLMNHNPKNLPLLNEAGTKELFSTDNPEKGLRLFRQDGGKFIDVTTSSGINGSELSYGLGIGISDLNADGWPDFYISNDYSVPDYLYINNKNGTFTNQLEVCMGHTSQFSMGNDIADVNNDGLAEIYTLDMLPMDNRRQKLLLTPDNFEKFDLNLRSGFYYQYMRNMLHLNNGNGTFSEAGQFFGISNTDWSWSALFADYNNDGWKDLYVTNGYYRDYTNLDFINYMNEYVKQKGRLTRDDVLEIIRQMPSSSIMNQVFVNNKGTGFRQMNEPWGIRQTSNSNGAAYADLDNDGDLDLIVNNINQPAFIYRNGSSLQPNSHYLQVKLTGTGGNTQGIGAKVKLFHNGSMQFQEQSPARGYLSSVTYVLHFGLGNSTQVDSLQISWNSGRTQTLYNVKADQLITLSEVNAKDSGINSRSGSPLFSETTTPIMHSDAGLAINDFNRQPLLIHDFSHMGPVMAKADFNKDGQEDLVIGGAGGQAIELYLQQSTGKFLQKKSGVFEKDKMCQDAALAVFDANGDGYPDIYAASGGYNELENDDAKLSDRLYLNDGKANFTKSSSLPDIRGSKSCVAAGDANNDGRPDIFVGGRVVPGKFPEIPRSYILINKGNGVFADETSSVAPVFSSLGMVTDAAWADLDGDKTEELVIAGEWMPIHVYKTENGKLAERSNLFFDKEYKGWWNTVEIADLNKDGKPDIIAGNTGTNTQFRVTEKEPLEMFYGDIDSNGIIDPIFSFYIQGKRYPYITRDELLAQVPSFRKRFSSYESYAGIGLDELLTSEQQKKLGHLAADHMETSCFLSGSGKYTMATLPDEAQYSSVFSVLVQDFNEDGAMDMLLLGNNSRVKIRLGKWDANYGTLILGDGKGNFRYMNQARSGFAIRGDVRSSVVLDKTILIGVNGSKLIAYKRNGSVE
ncbi:MAG TPA: VCBS repeat-containing protein [Chitinophagaceae bacterium]|nr:VCBS repeat-containing protein [Chitinophagaceae bacterium]